MFHSDGEAHGKRHTYLCKRQRECHCSDGTGVTHHPDLCQASSVATWLLKHLRPVQSQTETPSTENSGVSVGLKQVRPGPGARYFTQL